MSRTRCGVARGVAVVGVAIGQPGFFGDAELKIELVERLAMLVEIGGGLAGGEGGLLGVAGDFQTGLMSGVGLPPPDLRGSWDVMGGRGRWPRGCLEQAMISV